MNDDQFWSDGYIEPSLLRPHPRNPKRHPPEQLAQIRANIRQFGFTRPVLITAELLLLAGHGATEAAILEGLPSIPYRMRSPEHPLSEAQVLALIVADNKLPENGTWDQAELTSILATLKEEDFPLDVAGFSMDEADALFAAFEQSGGAGPGGALNQGQGAAPGAGGSSQPSGAGSLSERFMLPPFSVLNARDGWWQSRKQAWLSLGIRSEVGRPENLLRLSDTLIEPDPEKRAAMQAAGDDRESGTSIFDPVLAEIAYRWFCPPGGVVLDPFAGGSVRAIVAAKLGRRYTGIELRAEQIAANEEQARAILGGMLDVEWVEGDARELTEAWFVPDSCHFDLLFTCPPYFDLERYSDDPRDLSNMSWEEFLAGYRTSILRAAAMLRDDRFAVIVVGEVRDKDGNYRGLVPETIRAFEDAGLNFYNEAILITAVGSLPIRAGRTFAASRKLGKTHQTVLCFVKGDGARAAQACGIVEVPDEALLGAMTHAEILPGAMIPLDEVKSIFENGAGGELMQLGGELSLDDEPLRREA